MAEKSFIIDFPDLMAEWDWERNAQAGLVPSELTHGSKKKVWWLCPNGHSYDAQITNRVLLRRGCPVCSGKKAVTGINDLSTTHPDIAKEWDYERNGDLKPEHIVAGSNKMVWWKCSTCGFSWKQNSNHRTGRNSGCPYCSGRVAKTGINDLETLVPELAAEWDYEKNGDLLPCNVLPQSNQSAHWICSKGHKWQAKINDRYQGTGCPICKNKKIVQGYNDLQTLAPEIVSEWHPTKNVPLLPTQVSLGSSIKVWWLCKKGHEWQATIMNRTSGNHNCPICANQMLLQGYNDLETTHPDLAKEWHPTKNAPLRPSDVFAGSSHQSIWWMCRKGHEWQAVPNDRKQGQGCPVCFSELHTSFPEQTILFYLRKCTSALGREKKQGKELDIFLPEMNVGIEYNGRFYHQGNEKKDLAKVETMRKHGIRVVSVKESDSNSVEGDVICYVYDARNYANLTWAILQLFLLLELSAPDISISAHSIEIQEQYVTLEKENSIAIKYPEVAKEWHPTKNGKLTPEMMSCQSNIKVWWLGSCGHEWRTDVAHRVSGRGCPFCSNHKVLSGYNDLLTTNPQLAQEWHSDKNGDLKPTQVTAGSQRKVWWRCSKGHEWQADISSRNRGNGCPVCSSRRLFAGINDLLTVYPDIAKEWHPTLNGDFLPSMVTARNNKKAWWLCPACGHEWETRIVHRANGHGCPKCSNKKK